MSIIDCKNLSQEIRNQLRDCVAEGGVIPGLAVIIVGDDAASLTYVKNKNKACDSVGFYSEVISMPYSATTEDVVNKVRLLSVRNEIHGILVQLPLPSHIDAYEVIASIPPEKDVDALTPINMGRLLIGKYDFAPCTPSGIMNILKYTCGSVSGANCAIIGRSNIVGKPLAAMLTHANATVTLCHSYTEQISDITKQADILVSAVGKPRFITADMVKNDAIVIDVGINRTPDGKLVGDVCFDEVLKKVDAVTPVPGGVGVMTVTALLENTYKAALIQSNR